MPKLPLWLIAIIAFNISVIFIAFTFLNSPKPKSENLINESENLSTTIPEGITEPVNLTNNTSNFSISLVYGNNCKDSIENYVKNIENISNISTVKIDAFNTTTNVTSYLQHNWPSVFYDIVGMKKDVTDNITVVAVVNITTNKKREFILPILCDENGKIGNYSSCILGSVPNVPGACYNFTVNFTECEIELREHDMFDDIQYWVEPPGAAFVIGSAGIENNTTIFNYTIFNFTILSSRNRLESFGMSIIKRTFNPLNDNQIFSSTKIATNGLGGSIVNVVNITDVKGAEFYATVWFKKKCYDKYVLY